MSLNTTPANGQLQEALDKFEAVLTPEQKESLQNIATVPDPAAIIAFTTQLDDENAKRRSRCVATRLLKFLQSIQQFSTVVDTYVSSNPAIPALVWGSVKLAVLLTFNYASYFDKLSALFMSFSKYCPRYSDYQILYADSAGLQAAVCNFYAVVIDCFKETRTFWRPFKTDELGRFEKDIQQCKLEVDAEIDRALHETIHRERQLQITDRKAADRRWNLSSIFRTEVTQSNEEERRWRIQIDKRYAISRKQALLDKLSNYDYSTPFRQASTKRHGATTDWLITSTEFINWVSSPKSNMFLLSGKLGSGKTVLTASAVSHLFSSAQSCSRVIYFFCQFDNAESLNVSTILGSLIRQCVDAETLPHLIESRLTNLLKHSCPELKELGVLLRDVLAITKVGFILVDAIDDCRKPERGSLLMELRDVMGSCPGVAKLFLAVRQGIVEEVGNICKICYQATTNSTEAHKSIKLYIENVLAEKKEKKDLVVGNPKLLNEIRDALVKESNGMFLWVAFQIEDICSQECDSDIRETIKKLPKDLPETYNRIISRIVYTGHGELAKKIFLWVATSRRPMVMEELQEAIAVKLHQKYSDRERLVNDISQIVSWCGNLVVIDEENNTVQFTHQTVKTFLLNGSSDGTYADFHLRHPQIDHFAGEICVTYLNFNDFKRILIKQPKSLPLPGPKAILKASFSSGLPSKTMSIWEKLARFREYRKGQTLDSERVFAMKALRKDLGAVWELQKEHPFLSYASHYWLHHSAYFDQKTTQTWRLWENLLLFEDGPAQMPWKVNEWAQRTRTISRWIGNHDHVALLFKIASSETPFSNTENQYILNISIERQSLRLLDFILQQSICSKSVLSNCLVKAAGRGDLKATEKLLMAEIDITYQLSTKAGEYDGLTALQAAAKGGHLEVLERLLMAKAEVNAEARKFSGRTALQGASEQGHLEVVERLLAAGADVNAQATEEASVNAEACEDSGRTALQGAAEQGHLEVVERLLAEGAGVNAEASRVSGRTALQGAAEKGQLEVVEKLLVRGASVNVEASEYSGRTALQGAAEKGHLEVVERLLAAGADMNAEPGRVLGRTALQGAAEKGHLEAVERLLAAGAEVNAEAGKFDGRTALQGAADKGHLEAVERLLAAGAEVNAGPGLSHGRTAVQGAAEQGHLEVVERLLAAGADVNDEARGELGLTTFQAAAEQGHLEVVERLLAAGANVNAQANTYSGRTALRGAAEQGYLEVVERLLAAGAKVNARASKYNGRTALQGAAEHGHLEAVERLLAAGAKVNARASQSYGQTALHGAVEIGHLEVVEKLLAAKAAVNGESLKTAQRNGDKRILKLLESRVLK
ncbi:hypothetical protein MMC31_005390 [Peltigera leucophlebia]|nr:hypothetical protein [Peltigera leucophlebia]